MTSLCLACFSTILPGTLNTYTTDCCERTICNACLESNPRLKEYNPCLACCRGVQVVGRSSRKGLSGDYKSPRTETLKKDAEAFVIGEEDDDDQESAGEGAGPTGHAEEGAATQTVEEEEVHQVQAEDVQEHGAPAKYWLNKGDTLQGIALRFKLNARDICKLNNLPFTTLSTNPQLLHTRSFIRLPPTNKPPPPPPADHEEREERRRRERAAKQFQFVTKEVDWGIAKAYVALAEDLGAEGEYRMKRKEAGRLKLEEADHGRSKSSGCRTEGAVERYLDDEEWEREQIKAGALPKIAPFPYFASTSKA